MLRYSVHHIREPVARLRAAVVCCNRVGEVVVRPDDSEVLGLEQRQRLLRVLQQHRALDGPVAGKVQRVVVANLRRWDFLQRSIWKNEF